MMKSLYLNIIVMISSLISGCMGMAVSGAQAVYNRNALQNTFNDHYIDMQVNQAIFWGCKDFKESNIAFNTFNTEVLLTGQAPSKRLKEKLTQIASKINGVSEVHNFTEISTPSSALVRVSDGWITAKIKTQLIADNAINPDKIKIVTENGSVYLMGIVLPETAEEAIDIARATSGVQNVVSLFSFIKISKAYRAVERSKKYG
jgi:osmotically-inducible protein OsmY